MAVFNAADKTYGIVVETTPGVVPASPAFVQLPFIPGSMPMVKNDTVESNVRLPTRGSNGIRTINYSVAGANKVHFKRDAAIEILLSSALSATWSSNVLTAGKTETNFTIEQVDTDGTNKLFKRFSGCQVEEFSFDADFAGNIEADFTYVGMNMTTASTIVTSATYTAPNQTSMLLTGNDVTGVSIAGLSGLEPTKLSLKVTNDREAQGVLGTGAARGVGTSSRKVTGSITLYRKDFTPETVLVPNGTNPDVAMSFTLCSTASNGYTFTLPAVNFNQPQDAEDGSKVLVTLDFVASVDPTTNTDIKITRN